MSVKRAVFLLAWSETAVGLWLYATGNDPAHVLGDDPERKYAVVHLYPPTVIVLMLAGVVLMAFTVFPAVFLGRLFMRKPEKSIWARAVASVSIAVGLSGVWAGLRLLAASTSRGVFVSTWILLFAVSLLPVATICLMRKSRKAPATGAA